MITHVSITSRLLRLTLPLLRRNQRIPPLTRARRVPLRQIASRLLLSLALSSVLSCFLLLSSPLVCFSFDGNGAHGMPAPPLAGRLAVEYSPKLTSRLIRGMLQLPMLTLPQPHQGRSWIPIPIWMILSSRRLQGGICYHHSMHSIQHPTRNNDPFPTLMGTRSTHIPTVICPPPSLNPLLILQLYVIRCLPLSGRWQWRVLQHPHHHGLFCTPMWRITHLPAAVRLWSFPLNIPIAVAIFLPMIPSCSPALNANSNHFLAQLRDHFVIT